MHAQRWALATTGVDTMARRVSASEAKNRLGSIIDWVTENQEEMIVENRGEPTAVIISIAEYQQMQALKERARRSEALGQMRKLRDSVMARNRDLGAEEADSLADRFSREVVRDMAEDGKVRFEG